MTTIRILLAISSPGLSRVVEHLLREDRRVEIVDRSADAAALSIDAARTAPDLIVTSARFLGEDRTPAIAALRRGQPQAKLLVITCDEWGDEQRSGSADASVDEEDLVRSLVPLVQTLASLSPTR